MSLHTAVAAFAEALHADDFSRVRRVPQGELAHDLLAAKRAMLARYGIHRVGPTVSNLAWTVPPGAEEAEPGTVVRVPFRATLTTAPDRIEPGTLAAEGGSAQLKTLAGKASSLTYAGLSFVRCADGGWAKLGESGDGVRWTDAGSCQHGTPLGLRMAGFHAQVVASINGRDGARMHTVHLHNATAYPLIANLHRWPGPHPHRYAIRRTQPLEGFPIPPGWGLMLPLSRPADQKWTTVAVAIAGESTAWTPGLPLATAPGHPVSGTYCPGSERISPRWLSGKEALMAMRADAPLVEELLVQVPLDFPGTPAALTQVWELEDALTGLLEKRAWGRLQGNAVSADGRTATLYLGGADARRLLAVCTPLLKAMVPTAGVMLRTASGDHAAALG